jgi:glycerol-3-phosphate dehydrogenase subunit B
LRHVVVVGSGVAGTAAALAAARGGARVTLVKGGTGASVLAGGALDDVPWEDADGTAASLDPSAREVLDALGGYSVGEARALVLVTTGLVRPARGVDAALLDLARAPRGAVLVPDVEHGGWDAAALAREWSASPRARERGLRFVTSRAELLRRTEERAFADAELAALHDDPARLGWLCDRLEDSRRAAPVADVVAIALPPWLGVDRERATELSRRLGIACGEALGRAGGPSGLRFERARDRALADATVTVREGRASAVSAATRREREGAWRVDASSGELECDAVVLATGGVLGGGLEYTPAWAYSSHALPEQPRPLLRLTCEAPGRLGAFGRALDDPSSLFGAAPETHAWPYREDPLLDHAGLLAADDGDVSGAASGLYAAGELAAAAPRTWLAALGQGARAGHAASRARPAHPPSTPTPVAPPSGSA